MKTPAYILIGLGLLTSLTGCLNDEEHFTDFQNVGMLAEIPSSAFYGVEDYQQFVSQTAPVLYAFDVNVASPTPLSQDIALTVAVDKAALDAYNANKGTSYQLLPPTLYQLSGLTTTVKAGTRLAPITVSFFSGKDKVPDLTAYNNARYALPIRIVGAPTNVRISSNYSTKIIFPGIEK